MVNNVNYETLMSEINNLRKQAEMIRFYDEIEEIKRKIREYALKPEDVFDQEELEAYQPAKVVHPRKKPEPKFKDPVTGATWTGRGKTPNWMKTVIDKGGSKDDFSF